MANGYLNTQIVSSVYAMPVNDKVEGFHMPHHTCCQRQSMLRAEQRWCVDGHYFSAETWQDSHRHFSLGKKY